MKQIKYLFIDTILDYLEGFQRMGNMFCRTKTKPSLLMLNIQWFNRSNWVDRLRAYNQLDRWTFNK